MSRQSFPLLRCGAGCALLAFVALTIDAQAQPTTQNPVSFSVNGLTDPQLDALQQPGYQIFLQPWTPGPTPFGNGPWPFMRTTVQIPKPCGVLTTRLGDVEDYYLIGGSMMGRPDGEIFQSEPDMNPAGLPNGTNNQILKAIALGLSPDYSNINALSFGEDFFSGDEVAVHASAEFPDFWSWGGRTVANGASGFIEPVVNGGSTAARFFLSVDTWAVGLAGTDVQNEATMNGTLTLPVGPPGAADTGNFGGPWISDGTASGDVYYADPVFAAGSNYLEHDEWHLALLAPRPPFASLPPTYWSTVEDDLDALECAGANAAGEPGNTHDRVLATLGVNGGTHVDDLGDPTNANHDPDYENPIIFSVDRASYGYWGSAVRSQVYDPDEGASADLFIGVTIPPPSVFAGTTTNMLLVDDGQLGLMPHDDIDAVAIDLLIEPAILESRIVDAVGNFDPTEPDPFDPTVYSRSLGFTIPLLAAGEAVVAFSVDNASMGVAFSAVDFECRVDGLGLTGPGYSGSGLMEQGGDIFYSDLRPVDGQPDEHPYIDLGTDFPLGQNYLWFEETSIGLDPGGWSLVTISGNLGDAPDELNGLDTVLSPLQAVRAISSRGFAMTIASSATAVEEDPIALRLTSPDYPCLEAYVSETGFVVETAVFQSPEAWGTVFVHGVEILPATTYVVEAETEGGTLTELGSTVTWPWGDVNDNGAVNFEDILFVVQAFQGNFQNVSLEAADLEPCVPNGVANFVDVLMAVKAFQGETFVEATGCDEPCA